jgi:hypothetical protein
MDCDLGYPSVVGMNDSGLLTLRSVLIKTQHINSNDTIKTNIPKLNNEIPVIPTACPFSLSRSLSGVNKSRDPIAMRSKAINIKQKIHL